MKNSIIIAIIAFGAIFSTNSVNANTYPSPNNRDASTVPSLSANPLRIIVTVNFGKRSKDCTGFGVCSIVISAELARPSATSGSGTADVVNGKLVVSLNKSSMTREALAKYFPNNKFTVEEDFQVAQEIVSPRDVATGQASGRRQYQPLVIRKGVYDVKDNGSTLTIAF